MNHIHHERNIGIFCVAIEVLALPSNVVIANAWNRMDWDTLAYEYMEIQVWKLVVEQEIR